MTVLPDRDDGIDVFKILGDKIMLIMMNGSAYFLNNSRDLETNTQPVDIKINVTAGNYKFTPFIAPIKGNAYVATPR